MRNVDSHKIAADSRQISIVPLLFDGAHCVAVSRGRHYGDSPLILLVLDSEFELQNAPAVTM